MQQSKFHCLLCNVHDFNVLIKNRQKFLYAFWGGNLHIRLSHLDSQFKWDINLLLNGHLMINKINLMRKWMNFFWQKLLNFIKCSAWRHKNSNILNLDEFKNCTFTIKKILALRKIQKNIFSMLWWSVTPQIFCIHTVFCFLLLNFFQNW